MMTAAPSRRSPRRPRVESLEGRLALSTLVVTTTADSGPGSLRAAIAQADADTTHDTIVFDPTVRGTITLLTALPDLTGSITIAGPGAVPLTVARGAAAGTPDFRILTVTSGADVSVSGLVLTGGSAGASDGGGVDNAGILVLIGCTVRDNSATSIVANPMGGGIFNTGTLTVADSTLSGNSSHFGGAIFNSGTLTVTGSTFSDNTVLASPTGDGSGGGISNSGEATVAGSTFRGNAVVPVLHSFGGDGGGVDNSGTLTVTDSTFEGNRAASGAGLSSGGMLTVIGSTFDGNAAASGGGLSNSGTATVAASTFTANSADALGDLLGGGGIANVGTLDVINSTLAGNSAVEGGGIWAGGGTLALVDCTLAGNTAGAASGGGVAASISALTAGHLPAVASIGSLYDNPTGGNVAVLSLVSRPPSVFDSFGHNLFSDTPAVPLQPTDQTNADPLLGPLADNGGPTQTMALMAGSPAIGAGVAVPGVTTDQRGVPRPTAGPPDIGAFQSNGLAGAPPTVIGLARLGVHRHPTTLVLTFSAAMDPARATDLANYRLARVVHPHGPGGGRLGRTIPIAAATYDAQAHAVDLVPAPRLPLRYTYQLTVIGTPPGGLTSAAGVPLAGAGNGQAGTDDVTTFGRSALVLLPSPFHPASRPGGR